MEKLNINEIFYSIQGEGTRAGLPCVFIRLQGCMLRCSWCDTPYALELRETADMMDFEMIKEIVLKYNCSFIEFTGGEPLAQKHSIDYMKLFADTGYTVAVETNGHADVSNLDSRIIKIMDFKCPDSGMSKFNNYKNIDYLTKNDEIKFVVSGKADFDWALNLIKEHDLVNKTAAVIVSPVFGKIELIDLANMVLSSGLNIRMQLQMHKFIWHPEKRGV